MNKKITLEEIFEMNDSTKIIVKRSTANANIICLTIKKDVSSIKKANILQSALRQMQYDEKQENRLLTGPTISAREIVNIFEKDSPLVKNAFIVTG